MQPGRAGDAVWNPLSGEKALLIESAEETAGSRIVVDFAVEEGGFVPGGEHVHDICAEHFDVQQGRITFVVDGKERNAQFAHQLRVVRRHDGMVVDEFAVVLPTPDGKEAGYGPRF